MQWVVMRKNYPCTVCFPDFFFPRARQRKWFMFILRSEKPWKSLIRCLEDVTINKVDSSFPSFPLHIIQWSEWPKVCPNIMLFRPSFIYRTTLPFTASHVQKPEFLSNLNKKNAFLCNSWIIFTFNQQYRCFKVPKL